VRSRLKKNLERTTWLVALLFCFVSMGEAATITPRFSGREIYLDADGLVAVAGLDITLNYNADALTPSDIVAEPFLQGALLAKNLKQTGRARLGIVHATGITGSGTLVRIPVVVVAPGEDPELRLTVVGVDPHGEPVLFGEEAPLSVSEEGAEETTSASGVSGGVLVSPTTSEAAQGKGQPLSERESSGGGFFHQTKQQARRSGGGVLSGKGDDLRYAQGILDVYRSYQEAFVPETLLALFRDGLNQRLYQEPPIAFSDGEEEVVIHFAGRHFGEEYAIRQGKIVSQREQKSGTILTVLPAKGGHDVQIVLVGEKDLLPFHLTVVPQVDLDLDQNGVIDEGDIVYYLYDPPDLSGDGEVDSLDDYIFAGNYLRQVLGALEEEGR